MFPFLTKQRTFLKFYWFLFYSENKNILRYLKDVKDLSSVLLSLPFLLPIDFEFQLLSFCFWLVACLSFASYAYNTQNRHAIRKTLNLPLKCVRVYKKIKLVKLVINVFTVPFHFLLRFFKR